MPQQADGTRTDPPVSEPKTADSHIQRIYAKIGCSTRGAAVLFALQHRLVGD